MRCSACLLYTSTEKRQDHVYEIAFHDVSFTYPGSSTPVLKHLSCKLSLKHKMAVVGLNGAGKTTFIKLLCRLYDPTEGYITLNGVDIRKYDYQQYQSLFSVVFQDFQLFPFPVGQNVGACLDPDPERVWQCLELAGVADRIRDMHQGCLLYTSVSGQLNGETYAMAFKNIYTFGPTFRAENSNTTRHAAEFWMIEPEIAFADLGDDMRLAEDMIKYIIAYVLEHAPEEMAFFNQFVDKGLLDRLNHVLNSDFGHVTYTEAVELLEKHNDKFEYPVHWGSDLQTEHERYLTEEIFQRPVFVTDYPKEIKAFYMKLNPDGKTVAAMDCLVPGIGEIIGGSQREDNYDVLLSRIQEPVSYTHLDVYKRQGRYRSGL